MMQHYLHQHPSEGGSSLERIHRFRPLAYRHPAPSTLPRLSFPKPFTSRPINPSNNTLPSLTADSSSYAGDKCERSPIPRRHTKESSEPYVAYQIASLSDSKHGELLQFIGGGVLSTISLVQGTSINPIIEQSSSRTGQEDSKRTTKALPTRAKPAGVIAQPDFTTEELHPAEKFQSKEEGQTALISSLESLTWELHKTWKGEGGQEAPTDGGGNQAERSSGSRLQGQPSKGKAPAGSSGQASSPGGRDKPGGSGQRKSKKTRDIESKTTGLWRAEFACPLCKADEVLGWEARCRDWSSDRILEVIRHLRKHIPFRHIKKKQLKAVKRLAYPGKKDLSEEDLSEEDLSEEDLSEEDLSEEDLSEENLSEKNLSERASTAEKEAFWRAAYRILRPKTAPEDVPSPYRTRPVPNHVPPPSIAPSVPTQPLHMMPANLSDHKQSSAEYCNFSVEIVAHLERNPMFATVLKDYLAETQHLEQELKITRLRSQQKYEHRIANIRSEPMIDDHATNWLSELQARENHVLSTLKTNEDEDYRDFKREMKIVNGRLTKRYEESKVGHRGTEMENGPELGATVPHYSVPRPQRQPQSRRRKPALFSTPQMGQQPAFQSVEPTPPDSVGISPNLESPPAPLQASVITGGDRDPTISSSPPDDPDLEFGATTPDGDSNLPDAPDELVWQEPAISPGEGGTFIWPASMLPTSKHRNTGLEDIFYQ